MSLVLFFSLFVYFIANQDPFLKTHWSNYSALKIYLMNEDFFAKMGLVMHYNLLQDYEGTKDVTCYVLVQWAKLNSDWFKLNTHGASDLFKGGDFLK